MEGFIPWYQGTHFLSVIRLLYFFLFLQLVCYDNTFFYDDLKLTQSFHIQIPFELCNNPLSAAGKIWSLSTSTHEKMKIISKKQTWQFAWNFPLKTVIFPLYHARMAQQWCINRLSDSDIGMI